MLLFYTLLILITLFYIQRLLNSFVSRLFTARSFDVDFPLVSNIDGETGKNIKIPEGIRSVS